ncbi:MAG: glycosyltransferase [Cyanobacteria bacterium P01_C01_bin.120]
MSSQAPIDEKPNIVMFSSLLLPPSQTFVKAQGEELRQFTPYYVGSRRVSGLELPSDRTLVVNSGGLAGRIAEASFKLTETAPNLYHQVRQIHPVLIHAQFGLSGALVMKLARSLNLPLIVHYRGADATIRDEHARYASLNHWIYLQRRETLKKSAQLFITVSSFIKDKLIEQGFPSEKIRVHYSGINAADFTADPDQPREPIVLFVGRLAEKKGCEYLIRAMEQVQAHRPNVELQLIGDGPLRSELEQLAAQRLKKYCFQGFQPPSTVRSAMNQARILAAPSITAAEGDSEGLPNVVIEAQAMGLPVVSTLHAGIPEGVIHGETGFLAPERNVADLAQHCLKLLDDAELWQKFSARGQEHVRENFDRHKQTRVLEEIYAEILQK